MCNKTFCDLENPVDYGFKGDPSGRKIFGISLTYLGRGNRPKCAEKMDDLKNRFDYGFKGDLSGQKMSAISPTQSPRPPGEREPTQVCLENGRSEKPP